MIVIRIELWPGGSYLSRKTIAVGTIANVSGSGSRGDYEARFYGAGNGASGDIEHVYGYLSRDGRISREPWRRSLVQGFARKREGAWCLLVDALSEALGAALHRARA